SICGHLRCLARPAEHQHCEQRNKQTGTNANCAHEGSLRSGSYSRTPSSVQVSTRLMQSEPHTVTNIESKSSAGPLLGRNRMGSMSEPLISIGCARETVGEDHVLLPRRATERDANRTS